MPSLPMNRRSFVTRGLSAIAALGVAGQAQGRAQSAVRRVRARSGRGRGRRRRRTTVADVGLRRHRSWAAVARHPGRPHSGRAREPSVGGPTTVHWHGVPVPNVMDGVPESRSRPCLPAAVRLRVRRGRSRDVSLSLARRPSARSRVLGALLSIRANRSVSPIARRCWCSTTGCRWDVPAMTTSVRRMQATAGAGGGMDGRRHAGRRNGRDGRMPEAEWPASTVMS